VGIAIQSGTLLQKCGSYWCKINTSQVVNSSLINGTTSNVVAIGSSENGADCFTSYFNYWTTNAGNTKRTSQCNRTPSGLWFDDIYSNGIKNWFDSANSCSNKGMHIIRWDETTINYSGHVSHPLNGAGIWLSNDANNGTPDDKLVWRYNNTTYGNSASSRNNYFICVK
jgi:hypothetical protein